MEEWFLTFSFVLSGGTPTSGTPRLSDGPQADPLDGLTCTAPNFDLYSLDQLQEDDRESDKCVYSHILQKCSCIKLSYLYH